MKKILIMGGLAESLINFRGALIAAMVAQGYEIHACAPAAPPEVRGRLVALGAHYHDVSLSRTDVTLISNLITLWSVYRLLRSVQPDFFLSYTIKPVIYGSLAARMAGVPRIFSIITGVGYIFSTSGFKPWLLGMVARTLYWMALRCNSTIFFQNPDDLKLFISMGVVELDRTRIINGSGVDIDYFKKEPLPHCISFLLVARLLTDKGIREYVEAARRLRKRHPEVPFRLAGWLDENPAAITQGELQQWIESGVIEYLGQLADIRPAMAACAVYVLPSYREGTPRTVLEAMATGRAIVTSDAPGCRETVVDGENGFLVPVRDVDALECAMAKLILSPDIVKRMGSRSREIAVDKYDVRKVNATIIKHMGL